MSQADTGHFPPGARANDNRQPGAGALRAWLLAARPATLSAALVPVLVGTACAYRVGGLRLGPAFVALLGAFLIQIGTNLANDVFDYEKGADTAERLGPVRVTQAGLLTPAQVRRGMWLTFACAGLCGVYLTWVAGLPVVAIGVLSVLSGLAYTGGPYPLGYHGLGDVFVLVFFGFVAVCGTTFVQAGSVPMLSVLAAVPVGVLSTAILVVNNLRDRETDARAGKRTLAVRLGRRAVLVEYVALVTLAYLVPLILWTGWLPGLRGGSRWPVLLPLATLPLAVGLIRRVMTTTGPGLNRLLVSTAKLLLVYGLLFALGILLSAPAPGR